MILSGSKGDKCNAISILLHFKCFVISSSHADAVVIVEQPEEGTIANEVTCCSRVQESCI